MRKQRYAPTVPCLAAEVLERREMLAADVVHLEWTVSRDHSGTCHAPFVQQQQAGGDKLQQQSRAQAQDGTLGGLRQQHRNGQSQGLGSGSGETDLGPSWGRGGQQQGGLTQFDIDSILFVREEEKLARDVYLTLGQTWGTVIFDNIALSEQNHMDAVGRLIDRYDLIDPIVQDTVGVFNDPSLQRLYGDLTGDQVVELDYLRMDVTIQGGAASELAALKVGAFIEEFDILDIMRDQTSVTQNDVSQVFDNLLRGSRNHLRSFVSHIEMLGASYDPVLMTGVDSQLGDLDALYSSIIESDRLTGRDSGNGVDNGNGRDIGNGGGNGGGNIAGGQQSRAHLRFGALDQLYAEFD